MVNLLGRRVDKALRQGCVRSARINTTSVPWLDIAPSLPKRWRYRIAAMDPSHQRGYGLPRYYDVAFNFRDIGAECDVLAQLAQRRG